MRLAGILVLAVLAVGLIVWVNRSDEAERGRRDRDAQPPAPVERTDAPVEPVEKAAVLLHGIVLDQDRQPVAGVAVTILQGGKGEDTSDAEGRFAVLAGEYPWVSVGVRHPAYLFTRAWLLVGAATPTVVMIRRGAPLAVVVLAPDKAPVPGAKVTADFNRVRGVFGVYGWRESDRYGEGTTDAAGRVALGGMPEVGILLTIDKAEYAIHKSVVEMRGLDPVEHVVVLDGGGAIKGSVLSPDGKPVAGARVRIRGVSRPEATADEDGTYTLERVGAGTVRLIADADGFGPGYFGDRLGWGEPVPVTVRVGDTLTGIDIVLGKPTYVTGRIIDDLKQPVVGAKVNGWVSSGFGDRNQGQTDAEGRFRIGPFALSEPGVAHLWFEAGEHSIPEVHGKPAKPGQDTDVGTVKASRAAVVRGVVLDLEGKPVPMASVEVRPAWNWARADGAGRFEVKGIRPGQFHIVAVRYEPAARSRPHLRTVGVGEVVEGVELRLQPVKPIAGRVITPEGTPRVGVWLSNEPLDWEAPEDTRSANIIYVTNAKGEFRFPNVIDGRYRVGILSREDGQKFVTDPPPVEVAAGTEDVELRMPFTGGVVTGRVVSRRDGRPVRAFRAGFIEYKFFIPQDADVEQFRAGRFSQELEPGKWAVDVAADGFVAARTATFTIKEGEIKDVGVIRLGDGGTVAGVVRDAQGLPVPYARINILNTKFQTNSTEPFTDIDGRFVLKGISPDTYTVFAVSPRHPLGMVRNVRVKEGERTAVRVDFVAPAPLTVTVLGPGGRPIEDARLAFTFPAIAPLTSKLFRDKIPPGYGSHISDAEGKIHQQSLPPGSVTITIEAKGFKAKTRRLQLKAGSQNRVTVRLVK